jgi:hypothetical protein
VSREGRRRWGLFQTFVIGRQDNPMMKRLRVLQTPWLGVYVHFIYREDMDPVPHDHPWTFWRCVIRGGYIEHYFDRPEQGRTYLLRAQRRWKVSQFPTEHAHRIVLVKPGTVSLVVVGRKHRAWGFWGPLETEVPRRWVDYRDALGLRPTEGVSG